MHLSRIELTDYRAYPTAALDLPPSGLVLVAGPNNSGKSALLSAFDAAVRGLAVPDAGFGGKGEWQILLTFSPSEDERRDIVDGIHAVDPEFSDTDRYRQIVLTYAPYNGAPKLIALSCGPDADSVKPVARFDRRVQFQQVSALGVFGQGTDSGDWSTLQSWNDLTAPPAHPMFGLLKGLRELQGGLYHFEALRQGAPSSTTFNSTPHLEPTGANLPAVLRHLDDNDHQAFEKVAETLSDLVPEIGELNFRSAGNTDEVVLNDPLMPHLRQNLQGLGTGVEQLLLTLVVGIAQPQAKTILIEEPETALEPGAQRALLSLLQQWSNDRLFVISTHSTAMIDWSASASGQLYRVRRKEGRSSVEKVGDDVRDLLNALGVRMSDILSAETLLITEGSTDRDILGIFLPQLFQMPSVAIIPGGGGANARLTHVLQKWIAPADTLGRRLVFMRDRDELSVEDVEKLKKTDVVLVLKRREIENYFFDARALHQVFSSEKAISATVENIEQAIRVAADETKESVVFGRVAQQLPPIRLTTQDARTKFIDDPDKLQKLITMASDAVPTKKRLSADIKRLWAKATREVDAAWPGQWASLAPGEDVLMKLYAKFLGRKFNKGTDGLKLAKAVMEIHGAPEELRNLLADLV